MKKNEIKAIIETTGMQMLKNHITNQTVGFWCDSASDIAALDALAASNDQTVIVTKEYLPEGGYRYKLYCPSNWLDMTGFAD